jgi:hypothetical protein
MNTIDVMKQARDVMMFFKLVERSVVVETIKALEEAIKQEEQTKGVIKE